MVELKSYRKVRSLIGVEQDKLEKLAAAAEKHYTSFDTRIDGGKWRHIDNPKADLKSVQSRILRQILTLVTLPEHMYGTKRGGWILDHAAHHAGQECVMTLDLRNCFPRTTNAMVHTVFMERLGCSPSIANTLTRLCTVYHHVPQGAPTSGYLAHLALLDLYAELRQVARAFGLRLSMYVDDIAMSGTGGAVHQAIGPAIAVINEFGHSIRNAKKLVMTGDVRSITGLTVRDRVYVPERYLRDVEADIVAAIHAGVVSRTVFERLSGQLNWIGLVSSQQAAPLRHLLMHVQAGDQRTRQFAERRPCKGKPDCEWWKQNRVPGARTAGARSSSASPMP